MEHPLVYIDPELNADKLLDRINELNRKLMIATRSGNGHLCNQIRMAIDSYRARYSAIIEQQQKDRQGPTFEDRIDIS
jgi:hypothetical protein